MFAGMIMVPLAISSRISSAEIFSLLRDEGHLFGDPCPWRAKCIWLMLLSPVRAASALRLTIHSARYQGSEPPPDTFKDDSQALAVGTYGHDGVFHATELQAKCASKYAPVDNKKAATPATTAAVLPSSR
jgi:hypothetical protein